MPIYMCRWENGDISFVSAMSKDGAIWALDEVGAATAGMLYAVNQFMVHLTLDDHGELELESLGEDTEHFIRDVAYPIFNKVQAEMVSVDAEGTDEAQKLIAEAVGYTGTDASIIPFQSRRKNGGGGGSRTPVRKALRHEAYMLSSIPFVSPATLRMSKKRSRLVRWFSPEPYGPKGSGQLTV